MVEQRIFVLHLKTGQTVLKRHCKENADALLFWTIPDITPQTVSNDNPQQHNHQDNA
jgi:hypothetical protein